MSAVHQGLRDVLRVRRIASAMAAAVLVAASTPSPAGEVFVLAQARALDPAILEPAWADGVALQVGWQEVEPQEGRYDWRRLDAAIAQARQRRKRVTIHLLPLRPPEWLFAAGAEAFSFTAGMRESPMYGRRMREALPWDPVYLERWARLTRELGRRYNKEDTVFAVSVTAPAPEMLLVGGVPGTEAFRELERRYRKDVYLGAWRQMIDVYQSAFPDKPKLLVPGIVLFDEDFAAEVVAYARSRFGRTLWLFNTGLHAEGIPQARMGRGRIRDLLVEGAKTGPLGLQTIWSATDDPGNRMRGPLRAALAQGLAMGASYFEIYAADALNPRLQADLVELKGRLREPPLRR